MASGKSAYLEGVYLDWRFAMGAFASANAMKDELSIANQYVALFKGNPESGGVEVSGGAYARVALGWGAANWTRTNSVVTNDNAINFPTPTANWAPAGNEVTHFAIFDALTNGNMLESVALPVARIIVTGDPVVFAAGQIQFTED